MLTAQVDPPSAREKAKLRIRTASTKLTEAEFVELECFASQRGQSVSEWVRQTLLNEARSQGDSAMSLHIFTELVGIELLLMNTVGPLLRGERVTADQLDALLRQVQSTKVRKAQELFTKRLTAEEKRL